VFKLEYIGMELCARVETSQLNDHQGDISFKIDKGFVKDKGFAWTGYENQTREPGPRPSTLFTKLSPSRVPFINHNQLCEVIGM